MEQMEQYAGKGNRARVRAEMCKVCADYVAEIWDKEVRINPGYSLERWSNMCLFNYLRAYFKLVSMPQYTMVNKKTIKARLVAFDRIIKNAEHLNGTAICKIRDILKDHEKIRNIPERSISYDEKVKRVKYGALAEQLMIFYKRMGQYACKADVGSTMEINEQLLVPLIILLVVYVESTVNVKSELCDMGDEIHSHYYPSRSVEECRMISAVDFTKKCMAELLFGNENVMAELIGEGFDVSADACNCLCELTFYYTTILMKDMERRFIATLCNEMEWSKDYEECSQLIVDFEEKIIFQRLKENAPNLHVGKKDDVKRNYMKLIYNGFKHIKGKEELSDDMKPLLERLISYFQKDKDSSSALFKRYSTKAEWEDVLNAKKESLLIGKWEATVKEWKGELRHVQDVDKWKIVVEEWRNVLGVTLTGGLLDKWKATEEKLMGCRECITEFKLLDNWIKIMEKAMVCSRILRMFNAISLVEFGLQYGGTMEQLLFEYGSATMLMVIVQKDNYGEEEYDRAIFEWLCERLPKLQVELQEPSQVEISRIFSKYIDVNGRINRKILAEMYFDEI